RRRPGVARGGPRPRGLSGGRGPGDRGLDRRRRGRRRRENRGPRATDLRLSGLKAIGPARFIPLAPRRPLAGLALLASFALAVAAFARGRAAAADEAGVESQKPGPKPQLILIHGGSFLFQDPYFRPLTRAWAVAEGFQPHYLNYPLGNLPGAVSAARLEARRL